jgi:restriction system protein
MEENMAVPEFQSFFKPLLEVAADNKLHSIKEARDRIAKQFDMTEEDLSEKLPSGTQFKFDNRVAWAKSYFIQAKVLESPKRGSFVITQRGVELLRQNLDRIDIKILSQYPEFIQFHSGNKKEKESKIEIENISRATPEEALQNSYQQIRNDLAAELLHKVKNNSPKFFEVLVVDLLIAMGYGGSRIDAGKSIGQSGDEGLDGIINEDRLGLDVIYIQAKRWEGSVGRPEIQKFVGALSGKKAKKGVFITTGKFSDDAESYAEKIDHRVILIDGWDLVNYMIDFNIGVSTTAKYEIKKVDSDYFNEE